MLALYSLIALRKTLNQQSPLGPAKTKLTIYYLNHGENFGLLEMGRRENIFRRYIEILKNIPQFDLTVHTNSRNVGALAKRLGGTFEFTAAKLRNKQITRLARQNQPAMVVTGHQLSDWYETLIMRVQRGAGLSSLAPFSPWEEEPLFYGDPFEIAAPLVGGRNDGDAPKVLGAWFRPLVNLSREEVRQICQKLELPYWNDPTNKIVVGEQERQQNRRAQIRNAIPLYNPTGLRISGGHFLEAKEELHQMRLDCIRRIRNHVGIIDPRKEYRIDWEAYREFSAKEQALINGFILRMLGLSPLSQKVRVAANKLPFRLGPYAVEMENWGGRLYLVFRRGAASLEQNEKLEEGYQALIEKQNYRIVSAAAITKSAYISQSYGKKRVKKILNELRLSQRQRGALPLFYKSQNNAKEIDYIPLSFFGIPDIQSRPPQGDKKGRLKKSIFQKIFG